MELHEATWSYRELQEVTWSYMELQEATWSYMKLHGATGSYMELHGATGSYMELQEATGSYMELHGATGSCCSSIVSLARIFSRMLFCIWRREDVDVVNDDLVLKCPPDHLNINITSVIKY